MTEEELFGYRIPVPSREVYKRAKDRFDSLAKPVDGLGAFEDMICRIAAVQGTDRPDISKRALVIMCADNGVTEEGVSQCGQEVTAKVAGLMAKNSSSAGVMAGSEMVDIIPVDVGMTCPKPVPGLVYKRVADGTKNFTKEKAMSHKECFSAISAGIDIAGECHEKGIKIIATGEMGIGNTTTATALLCALTGLEVLETVGRGAGLTDEGLVRKTHVIEKGLALHKLNNTNKITPTNVYTMHALESVGGLDIAAIIGVYIGCGLYGMTSIIDGLISAVAALAADCICPGLRSYMLASHRGKEKGCSYALSALGLTGVIDADMALGEGTGAIMLFPLLDMVMSLYNEGTLFEETSIEKYKRYGL